MDFALQQPGNIRQKIKEGQRQVTGSELSVVVLVLQLLTLWRRMILLETLTISNAEFQVVRLSYDSTPLQIPLPKQKTMRRWLSIGFSISFSLTLTTEFQLVDFLVPRCRCFNKCSSGYCYCNWLHYCFGSNRSRLSNSFTQHGCSPVSSVYVHRWRRATRCPHNNVSKRIGMHFLRYSYPKHRCFESLRIG